MPSIEHNQLLWTNKKEWTLAGDQWSGPWGGVESQWFFTIQPRIHACIPADTILEIAPGLGRWTQYLQHHCRRLILVDLMRDCIESCKKRFSTASHIEYHTNDGRSLSMIADETIDFVFSFDSLVHAEADVIRCYLQQLGRKLKRNGIGFIHHSNIGQYRSSFKVFNRVQRPARLRMALKKGFFGDHSG
jgi:ubiquinone/menaquinone biosynthesis C-methylase UbiE